MPTPKFVITGNGVGSLRARLGQIAKKMPAELGKAMRQETEIEATEARRRTPVDTGALRASIHVEGPTFEGASVSTAIVAGGTTAGYAVYVHEDLDAFHKVGQAKFIESVLLESAPHMADRIGRRIDLNRLI